MENHQNLVMSEKNILKNIEYQIRNGQFSSKEKLVEYINNLRKNEMLLVDNKQIQELLNLYDSLEKKEENPLDMQKYASIGLENQNLIISKEDNIVLKTTESSSEFVNEFKQTQNEIFANNKDGMVNASAAFEHMSKYEKEEITLISLSELDSKTLKDIDAETLSKIRFFITNKYINPYSFKVDTKSGLFYNVETNEVYEVRKNGNTNQFEIYKGSEKVYGDNLENQETQKLESETQEDKMVYDSSLNKPKIKTRKKDMPPYMGNAAFTKVGFLIINIITFILLATMAVLLNK